MRTSATGVSKATFSTTARLYSSGWFLFHLRLVISCVIHIAMNDYTI
jgi:hypothetical protein